MNVDNPKEFSTVVSFCTGYGGIERGLELAGVESRTLAYVEIEAFACANLVAKMETGVLVPAPLWSDLKTFPSQIFRGRVDILTGGYPCQPFSAAGKRAGKDDPRHLWPYIRDHIETIRPVRCFFENVEGHISLGLREVIEDLEALGYKTAWGIFSAAEVGAPHQRKRVYILADAKSQRYGARREKRDIYQENGRQNWECLPEPAIASTRSGGGTPPVADSNDAGQQPSERQGQARHDVGGRGAAMADATGAGLASGKRSRVGTDAKKEQPRLVSESERRGDELADADSVRHDGRPVSDEIRERALEIETQRGSEFSRLRGETEGRGDELAYANSSRQQQSNKEDAGRSSKQPDGGGLRSRAISDTDSERLEGGIYRSVVDTEGRQKQEVRRFTERGNRGSRDGHQGWAFEPRLGRVVDGCADRIDRLRLLGNGVVPQTAAKAWEVLGGEING